MLHGRSEVEAEVLQRLSISSFLSAALSVSSCVHMQLRSERSTAQRRKSRKNRSARSRALLYSAWTRFTCD